MPPNVLIVDADTSAAHVTQAFVRRIIPAATVMLAQTPEHARGTIEQHRPDVLIVDPLQHGPTTCHLIHHLRQQSPSAGVVILASKPTPALRTTMQAMRVDVYLEKTAALPLLLSKLQAVFERDATQLQVPPLETSTPAGATIPPLD